MMTKKLCLFSLQWRRNQSKQGEQTEKSGGLFQPGQTRATSSSCSKAHEQQSFWETTVLTVFFFTGNKTMTLSNQLNQFG